MLGRLLAEWQAGPVGCLFLLPLWNPVLVAEQVGTLAALTKATFVVQTGVGDGEEAFKAMGASMKTRGADLEKKIAIIKSLFAKNDSGVQVNPVPAQKVEWWIGASTSKEGIRRAARLGDAWYAAPFLNATKAGELLEGYLEACKALNTKPRPIIRKDVIVLKDERKAEELGDQLIRKGYRGMQRDAVIVGNPEQAAEQLRPYKELGFSEVTCRCMTLPQKEAIETIGLLAEVRSLINS